MRMTEFSEGYASINGVLYQCKSEGAVWDVKNDKLTYRLFYGGEVHEVNSAEVSFYYDKGSFLKGSEMSSVELDTLNIVRGLLAKYEWDVKGCSTLFAVKDGGVIKVPTDFKVVTLENYGKIVDADGHKARSLYRTIDDALLFNKLDAYELDGSKSSMEGDGLGLLLTDKQRKVAEKFEAAFKALKDAGIGIVKNLDRCEMYLVNMSGNKAGYMFEDYDATGDGGPKYHPLFNDSNNPMFTITDEHEFSSWEQIYFCKVKDEESK